MKFDKLYKIILQSIITEDINSKIKHSQKIKTRTSKFKNKIQWW